MWSDISKVEGFFTRSNLLVWESLLKCQADNGIVGNIFEIGVWKGRSTAALSRYKSPTETLILVDFLIEHFSVVADLIARGFVLDPVVAIAKKSSDMKQSELSEFEKTVRWFHIDGDHSAQVTSSDLAMADRLTADDGIIVIDDFFNPRYVAIVWAVFDYMRSRPHSFRMLLAGDNKAYLCRPSRFAMYRAHVLQNLPKSLADFNASPESAYPLALHQPYGLADCETIGIAHSFRDGRSFLGFDTDPEMATFDTISLGQTS